MYIDASFPTLHKLLPELTLCGKKEVKQFDHFDDWENRRLTNIKADIHSRPSASIGLQRGRIDTGNWGVQ